MNAKHINLERIRTLNHALGELASEVVYIGGATVALYATDHAAEEVRPTEDVDIVMEIDTYNAYTELERRLRTLGFANDQTSGIICRYIVDGITVDIMPTEGSVLGFNNQWYPAGFRSAITYAINDQTTVRIFSPPHFLAAKLDAFRDRGGNDGRTSTDFEDIVYLLNNRPSIWAECAAAPADVREYLQSSFSALLANGSIEEWLTSHLEYQFADEQALSILAEMRHFAEQPLA